VGFGAKIREFQKTRLFKKGGKNVRIFLDEKSKKGKRKNPKVSRDGRGGQH
jgi:hypothetical protein